LLDPIEPETLTMVSSKVQYQLIRSVAWPKSGKQPGPGPFDLFWLPCVPGVQFHTPALLEFIGASRRW